MDADAGRTRIAKTGTIRDEPISRPFETRVRALILLHHLLFYT